MRDELEDAGDGALAAQAIDEIVALLGTDFRRQLKPLAESRWAHDPFARGSYSHALPGHAGERAVLAAPVDGRLFFAGEATSPNFFSTAHGARDSGEGRRGSGCCGSNVTVRSYFASIRVPSQCAPTPHPARSTLILPENPVAVPRDEIVDRVAQRLWHRAQTRTQPQPGSRQHRQRGVDLK